MNSLRIWPRRTPVAARFDAAAAALVADGTDDPVFRTHRVRLPGSPAGGRPRFHRARPRAAAVIDPVGGGRKLLACQVHDPDLWFADAPSDLEVAKALCAGCPVQAACLAGAVDRRESAGVWGGQIFHNGSIVTHKRPRGRPREQPIAPRNAAPPNRPTHPVSHTHRPSAEPGPPRCQSSREVAKPAWAAQDGGQTQGRPLAPDERVRRPERKGT